MHLVCCESLAIRELLDIGETNLSGETWARSLYQYKHRNSSQGHLVLLDFCILYIVLYCVFFCIRL